MSKSTVDPSPPFPYPPFFLISSLHLGEGCDSHAKRVLHIPVVFCSWRIVATKKEHFLFRFSLR